MKIYHPSGKAREREREAREREIRLDTRLVSNTPFSVGGVIRGMRSLRPGCDIGTQSYGYMRVSTFRSLSWHALGTDTEGVAERVRTPVAPPGHSRLKPSRCDWKSTLGLHCIHHSNHELGHGDSHTRSTTKATSAFIEGSLSKTQLNVDFFCVFANTRKMPE